jgi:hypothetical protein
MEVLDGLRIGFAAYFQVEEGGNRESKAKNQVYIRRT